MTPSVVQSTGAFNATAGQTGVTSAAFGSSVTPGNMIVVCGYANNVGGGTPFAPTFTDSKGNTWGAPDKFQAGVPKDPSEFMYYGHTIVGAGKGGTGFTVTATYASGGAVSAGSNRIFAVEVAGADTMDGAAVLANGTSATAAANFPVTAAAASYIAALALSENGITAAAPSGWVSRIAEGSETLYDQITTTTGTKSLSVSAGGSNQWCIIGGVFYAAPAVSLVQSAVHTAGASGTTRSLQFTNPTTNGNTLLVAINCYGLDDVVPTLVSVDDGGTNAFVIPASAQQTLLGTDYGMLTSFAYVQNCVGKTTHNITVTLGTSGNPWTILTLYELTPSQFDQATKATGSGLSVSAGTLTPSSNRSFNVLVCDYDGVPASGWQPPAGWTAKFNNSAGNGQSYSAYYPQATAAALPFSVPAGISGGSPNQWIASGASFVLGTTGGPVAITPTAAAAATATALVTAGAIEGPTIVSAATAQATARVTAPIALTPTASITTQALTKVTAIQSLAPTAQATGQATVTLIVPGVAALGPTAQTTAAAIVLLTAAVGLTPQASATGQATALATAASALAATASATTQAMATVTAASVATPQALTPTAQATVSATALATAATGLNPVGGASARALATVTTSLVPFVAPSASASTSATSLVTAAVRLTPTAQMQTQASEIVTVPMPLAPVAASTTQATGLVQGPVVLTPIAAGQTSATARAVVTVLLQPAATSSTSATAAVATAFVPFLMPVAQTAATASSEVGVPVALVGVTASSTTRATVIVSAAALVAPEPPLYADVFSNRTYVDVIDSDTYVDVISPKTTVDVI